MLSSPGAKVLYTSASLSLAIIEILVHLDDEEPISAYSYAAVAFAEHHLTSVVKIPSVASPVSIETQRIGDEWVESRRSLVMEVPTAIVPGERNYLVNVNHPDFRKIKLGKPQRFVFDQRLVRRRTP